MAFKRRVQTLFANRTTRTDSFGELFTFEAIFFSFRDISGVEE